MFKKIVLTVVTVLGLIFTPQHLYANPLDDVEEGVNAVREVYEEAHEAYEEARPFIVRCGKAIKNACKKIRDYMRRNRNQEEPDVYVNPLRVAAAAGEDIEGFNELVIPPQVHIHSRHEFDDRDLESSPF